MSVVICRLLQMSFAATVLAFVIATPAHAQSEAIPHRAASPLFVPAFALIGAGAWLAYRRSRPTD